MGLLTNNKLLTEKENISSKNTAKSTAVKGKATKTTTAKSGKKSPQKNGKQNEAKTTPAQKTSAQQKNIAVKKFKTKYPTVKKNTPPAEQPCSTPVKFTALGGLNEIGKNLYVYECGNDMLIVDCGLAFPDDDMPGVDLVVPDFTYLEKNKDRFRGIVITHGHEDHIGSLAYLLKKVNVPIYGTRLTLGLVEGKLKEHNLLSQASLNVVVPRQQVKLGCMSVEFIRVNHSIPDACALAIHTPAGVIIHTGDFKVDYTPIEGGIIDLARFGELGNKGVLALMSESTNAERPGYTKSERSVGESFR